MNRYLCFHTIARFENVHLCLLLFLSIGDKKKQMLSSVKKKTKNNPITAAIYFTGKQHVCLYRIMDGMEMYFPLVLDFKWECIVWLISTKSYERICVSQQKKNAVDFSSKYCCWKSRKFKGNHRSIEWQTCVLSFNVVGDFNAAKMKKKNIFHDNNKTKDVPKLEDQKREKT